MSDYLYDRDILVWSEHQAALPRRAARGQRVGDVDWDHVADEIEDVGRSELHAAEGLVERMLAKYGRRESERIYIVPTHVNLDCQHNYPVAEGPWNAATDLKGTRQNNGVHPAGAGYNQIGDTVYANISIGEWRKTSKPGTGVVKFCFDVVNHRAEKVQTGSMTVLFRCRGFSD